MFAIGKQYRTPAYSPMFVSNDTTFARSRQIRVDTATPSTDQRPVLADVNSFNDYRSLGFGHKVQNDIGKDRIITVLEAEIDSLAAVITRDRAWIKAEGAA